MRTQAARNAGGAGQQLVLAEFAPGQVVRWHTDRGWRVGRFVGVAGEGRRCGMAEVALDGADAQWVPPERLRAWRT